MNPVARRLLGAAAAAIARKLLPDAVPEHVYRTNQPDHPGTALTLQPGTSISRLPESQPLGTPRLSAADPLRGYDPRELYVPPVAPPPVYYVPAPPPAPPRKRRKKITVTERVTYWRS